MTAGTPKRPEQRRHDLLDRFPRFRNENRTDRGDEPLERLAQLIASNDRLMSELEASRSRVESARANLDRPGGNARFAAAHFERTRSRHSGILAQLRANRIEALRLLDEGSSER